MNRPFKFRAWFAKAQVFLPVEWLEFWEHANGETYVTVHTRTDFERGGWFSRVQEHTNRLTSLDGNKTQVPRVHLMQYTGLKDKNGVEVYEGDILENENGLFKGVVKFGHYEEYSDGGYGEYTGFYLDMVDEGPNGGFQFYLDALGSTVIGNIYENPELLKEGSQ